MICSSSNVGISNNISFEILDNNEVDDKEGKNLPLAIDGIF